MKQIKGELVRITTEDGLELHGLFFEPRKKTNKVIVHVHGWVGNFYENKFIDNIAKKATFSGFAFLTFNNRGNGIVTDLIKRNKSKVEYKRIGGSLEKFEDSILDIKAAVDFLNKLGYQKFVLEGHSLGCQKVTYYKYKTKDQRVRGLILLAPVDDVAYTKERLGNKYEESLKLARKEIKKKNQVLPEWMEFYPMMTTEKFLDIADPNSVPGRLFHYNGNLNEVKSVGCPIFSVFGSKDDYQQKPKDKLTTLKAEVDSCTIKLIENSGHGFVGFEEELASVVGEWIKIDL